MTNALRLEDIFVEQMDFDFAELNKKEMYCASSLNSTYTPRTVYDDIRQWAHDRNLIEGSTPEAQITKTFEEVDELFLAIEHHSVSEIIDAIGDVTVTLVIIAEQLGLRFESCVAAAYDEIKDRKGKMVDGLFVKDV